MYHDPRHIQNALDENPMYRAECAEVIAALLNWYSEDGHIVSGRKGPQTEALIFEDDATLGEHLETLL
jgi:hypothetical protein